MVKNKFKFPKTFLAIILLTAYCLPLTATVRYVSHEGSNTPPYLTWETAADSIMSAINISVFGDTIYVANGVYKEQVIMIPGLALIGAGMDSTVIDTREFPLTSPFYSVKVTDSSYFAWFQIITYDEQHGFGIRVAGENGLVEFNKIRIAKLGIDVFTGGLNLVRKNMIAEVKNGIECFFTNSIIQENIIYAKGNGLVSQTNSAPTYINNIVVLDYSQAVAGFLSGFDLISILKNNTFIAYNVGSIGYGIETYSDTISNNIIIGEWNYGIFTAGSEIRNNHIEKTITGLTYDSGSGISQPVVQYNNWWLNQSNFNNFNPDTTNIYFNPMFVNEDSLDFHLQKYSPLIDAGDPDILDLDGSRSDIGLYGGPFGERYKYIDLAPKPPRNLSAVVDSEYIILAWNPNTEADFNSYNLFRDTTANFTADSTTFVASLTDTFYVQIIPGGIDAFYYKLTATDNQGNESQPSEELAVIITSINEYPATVSNYRLYQNYPNPFNPSTKIAYKLKERGYVKLYVYDIKGELVDVLVNQVQEAGYYEVEFFGEVGSGSASGGAVGNQLSSGIYIYQIMIKSDRNIPVFSDMKKMIYLK